MRAVPAVLLACGLAVGACRGERNGASTNADTPSPAPTASAVPGKKITLNELEEMFASMRVKTKWNLDGPMAWGYFFVHNDRAKLEPVAKRLTAAGFRFVEYLPPADGGPHILHLERIEQHTPKSLDARNEELYRVAFELGVQYDGMDVGPVEGGSKGN